MYTYTYMTCGTSDNGSLECELENRVGAALRAAGAVKTRVLENRELSIYRIAKMVVNNAMVVPTLTYGAKSWVLKEREKQRVQAVEMRVFRRTQDCLKCIT